MLRVFYLSHYHFHTITPTLPVLNSHMQPVAPALDNTDSYILQKVRGVPISRGLNVFPSPSQPLSDVCLLYTSS